MKNGPKPVFLCHCVLLLLVADDIVRRERSADASLSESLWNCLHESEVYVPVVLLLYPGTG